MVYFWGRIQWIRKSCTFSVNAPALLFFIFTSFLLLTAKSQADNDISREQSIKAAYLYHLTKFIDWPKEHTHRKGETINLCVFGDNAFNRFLQHIESRTAKGRSIKLLRLDDDTTANPDCQLVYFDKNSPLNPKLVQAYNQQATLTVSEQEDFLANQGMVAMVLIKNHVRLQINHSLAKEVGINISANLLEVAALVK